MTVTRKPFEYRDGDKRFVGELALDEAVAGPRPGVLVVHEGGGINDHPKWRASLLAEMGYVALACDLYGDGELTRDAERRNALMNGLITEPGLLRRRVRVALEQLVALPQVDKSRVAAIGYCFGGMTVLELARSGADIAGIVSFHGLLRATAPAEPGAVKAKLLVCHGVEDPLVPPEQVAAFVEEMKHADADWQMVTYAHAGHGFTRKDAGALGMKGVFYEERADRRSWAAMKELFAEVFGS
jgi:dienelactone hydrolase